VGSLAQLELCGWSSKVAAAVQREHDEREIFVIINVPSTLQTCFSLFLTN
jgi:hypothetical protein